jgi:hypothetical protein
LLKLFRSESFLAINIPRQFHLRFIFDFDRVLAASVHELL